MGWAILFLLASLFFAVLGFGNIAVDNETPAQWLFVVFMILFLLSLLFGRFRRTG